MCRPCMSSLSDARLSEEISAEYVDSDHVKMINTAGGVSLSVMAIFFNLSAALPYFRSLSRNILCMVLRGYEATIS